MEEQNKFLIPGAIVFAGVIVGLAVIYSVGGFGGNKSAEPAGTAALGKLSEVSSADFTLGEANAPVTIVEYADFQCPFCSKYFKDAGSVFLEKYVKTGKARFVYRDFAFLGQESLWAANAARCAGEQGKYWEYHDYLYNNQGGENQGAFSNKNLKSFASVLNLNHQSFDSCLDSDKYISAIQKQTKDAGTFGVQGTPATFINGALYAGALPSATFTQIIDAELSKLGK